MRTSEHEEAIIDDLGTAQKFKFMVHRQKGSWDAKSLDTLITELGREMIELKEELNDFRDGKGSPEKIISECADAANYLAMIVEKVKKGKK